MLRGTITFICTLINNTLVNDNDKENDNDDDNESESENNNDNDYTMGSFQVGPLKLKNYKSKNNIQVHK